MALLALLIWLAVEKGIVAPWYVWTLLFLHILAAMWQLAVKAAEKQ